MQAVPSALLIAVLLPALAGCFGGEKGEGCQATEGCEVTCEAMTPDCGQPVVPPEPDPGNPAPMPSGIPPANQTYGPPRNWTMPEAAAIRPGASLDGGSCTANFVFTSLDNTTVYLGTAAHCFSNDVNTQTNGCAADIQELNTTMRVQGGGAATLVYSSWSMMQQVGEPDEALCRGNDFALLQLMPADLPKVNPALRRWGGPTGISEGATSGDKVLSYGNSGTRPADSPLSPREGFVTRSGDLCDTSVAFPNSAIPGDSGSPVILEDGRALGVFVAIGITGAPGQGLVCLLTDVMDYAAKHGFPVQLATWEQMDSGIL